MSSYESIYRRMASSLERREHFDSSRHISPAVAHELNNILTIIQGYSDRLLIKNNDNLELHEHLQLISEAATRAATVIRDATPPRASIQSPIKSSAAHAAVPPAQAPAK